MKTSDDQRCTREVSSSRRHPWLRIPDLIAINVIVIVAASAAVVSMMESYTNLLDFALNHQLHGWRADAAPGAVDSFIIVGEFLLFVVVYRSWNTGRVSVRWKLITLPAPMVMYGWALATFGFTLSVLGNLGHLSSAGAITRLMSAVFPVSATVALAAVLMILKRVVQDYREQGQSDIRPHGELLYLLGGFTQMSKSPMPVPPEVAPVVHLDHDPVLPPVPLPRPHLVTDSSVVQLKRDTESWEVKITPAIRAALEAGTSALKLTEAHPELGSKFRTQQLINEYQAGRIELAEHGEKASGE